MQTMVYLNSVMPYDQLMLLAGLQEKLLYIALMEIIKNKVVVLIIISFLL
jgi:hypothetical protein